MNSSLENDRPSRLYFNFLILYIVFSVINWLPLINNEFVRIGKYLIFIIIFLFEIRNQKFRYPSFYLSPFGFLLIILSMSFGLVISFKITPIVDILLPFIILWIFNFDKQFYYLAIYKSALIISIICGLSIISHFTGFFDIPANGPWKTSFGNVAFGGSSTAYSGSLFLLVVFLVYWHKSEKKPLLSIEILSILVILISQYISGGRGGLLASVIVIVLGLNINIFYKFVFIFIFFVTINSNEFLVQMRILNQNSEEIDVDQISSGRIELNTYFYEKFLKNPIYSYGFNASEKFGSMDPHIVWLKNAVNGGVIYLFFLIGLFIEIFRRVKMNITLEPTEIKLFFSLFFISFLITFLEPNFLIGSVQGEFVYWLLISLLIKPNYQHEEALK